MAIDIVRGVLLWSGLINYVLLIVWVSAALIGRKFSHRVAGWFGVSGIDYDRIQFAGILLYKLAIFLLFLGPYFALRIVG